MLLLRNICLCFHGPKKYRSVHTKKLPKIKVRKPQMFKYTQSIVSYSTGDTSPQDLNIMTLLATTERTWIFLHKNVTFRLLLMGGLCSANNKSVRWGNDKVDLTNWFVKKSTTDNCEPFKVHFPLSLLTIPCNKQIKTHFW